MAKRTRLRLGCIRHAPHPTLKHRDRESRLHPLFLPLQNPTSTLSSSLIPDNKPAAPPTSRKTEVFSASSSENSSSSEATMEERSASPRSPGTDGLLTPGGSERRRPAVHRRGLKRSSAACQRCRKRKQKVREFISVRVSQCPLTNRSSSV